MLSYLIVAGVLSVGVIVFAVFKRKATFMQILDVVIHDAVLAVEQLTKTGEITKEERKAVAMKMIRETLKSMGYGSLCDALSDEVLGFLIEAAVLLVNQFVKEDAPAVK